MSAIFDPGALMAAKAMSPEGVLPPLPRAPLVPSRRAGSGRVRAMRRAVARALAELTSGGRRYEPTDGTSRPLASQQ